MKKFIKIIFSLILIILIGATIGIWYFIQNFDLNSYKKIIEEQAYNYTGRQLKINGNAHLGISLIPTLVVDDITFSNASWAQHPEMLKIKNLKIEISVIPLLNKEIVINDITLVEPQIYLEKSSAGMENWNFSKPQETFSSLQTLAFAQLEQTSDNQQVDKTSPLPDFIKQISIKNIGIDDGFVQYIDEQSKQKQELYINSLDFSMQDLDSPINAKISAVYEKNPIKMALKLGSFNSLFTPDKPFAIDADIQAYNLKALINGNLFNVTEDISFDVMADITSPNGNFDLPATTVQTGVKGNLTKVIAAIKQLSIADNIISGTLKIDISKNIPQIAAILKSPKINLLTLQTKKTASNFTFIKNAYALESVPNELIPYDTLRLLNADVVFNIQKLIIDSGMSANNVALNASLKNGILDIKPLTLDFGSGKIDLTAVLNASNQTLNLKLNSKDILLQDLHKEFIVDNDEDFGILSGGKTLLNMDISSHGKTYRQIAQNMKGQIIAILSESKIQTGSLQFLTNSFVSQLLNVLKIDTKKSGTMKLQCAVARTDVADGKAIFPNGIALQSDKLTLSSDGKINLLNDKIMFTLNPSFSLKSGIAQALGSLINIGGTLENPQIVLDDKQAVKTLVSIATTGAAGYIGSQTITSDSSPCYTALKNTAYQKNVPQPSAASKAQQQAISETKAAYKETKAAVKQELKNIEKNTKDFINMFKRK